MRESDNFLTILERQLAKQQAPFLLCDTGLGLVWANQPARVLFPALDQERSLWKILNSQDCEALLRLTDQQGGTVNNFPLTMPLANLQLNLLTVEEGPNRYFLLHLLTDAQLPAPFPSQEGKPMSLLSDQNRAQISSIFGALFSLKRQIPPSALEPLLPYLNIINQSSYQLLRTCVNLSDFARFFTDTSPLHLEPLDLSALVLVLCGALQSTLPELTLCHQVEPDLCVLADEKYLTNALLNLVGNSLKYNGDHPRLDLTLRASGEAVLLTLADNGWGIPPEYLSRVCDPYFSYHPRGEFYSGVGLGLTNAKSIVSAHHGTLLLESQPDNGTRVTISLPLLEPPQGPLSLASDPVSYLKDRFSSFHVLLCELPGILPND